MMPCYFGLSTLRTLSIALIALTLIGCQSAPQAPSESPVRHPGQTAAGSHGTITAATFEHELDPSDDGREVAMFALTMLRTGYVFGGKNRSAGVDCSGLVTVTYKGAVGKTLTGNAASLARQGREIPLDHLRAGDLVFFNTLGRSFSHVGIYLGNGGTFIHAPNSRGRVRVEKLTTKYWAQRFEMARTLVN